MEAARLQRNTILVGDVRQVLKTLPDESVHCVVTSPPYWGLRDYGVEGQIGMEKTPEEFIAKMVEIFREVRRVLRKDGTCWLNLGDSYCNAKGKAKNPGGRVGPNACLHSTHKDAGVIPLERPNISDLKQPGWLGMKSKDLCMIPARVAIALQADGWYLRSVIIWHKPNPMPESVTDRPTKSHEYLYFFTKSPRYWYDAEAIKEDCSECTMPVPTGWDISDGSHGTIHKEGRRGYANKAGVTGLRDSRHGNAIATLAKKNKRDVWTVATEAFSEAHFATFPQKLIEPCILAGCPEWVCPVCGKARERIVDKRGGTTGRSWVNHDDDLRIGKSRKDDSVMQRAFESGDYQVKTVGWTDCGCGAGFWPGVVLDPFMGSGTTGLVAYKNRRDWMGIELNAAYAEMAQRRIRREMPVLFNENLSVKSVVKE